MQQIIELLPLAIIIFTAGVFVQQVRTDLADLKQRMIVVENKLNIK